MTNTEVTIMVMNLERERRIRPEMLERERRIGEFLAEDRARLDGMPRRARHLANGVRHSFRRWLQLPWEERTPRAGAPASSEA